MGADNLKWHKIKFASFLLFSQLLFIILFVALVQWSPIADRSASVQSGHHDQTGVEAADVELNLNIVKKETEETVEDEKNEEHGGGRDHSEAGAALTAMYPMFQDVHVMIFVGFGFLMMFLKKYGFSAVGYNFMLSAFVIQYSILVGGIIHIALSHLDGEHAISKIYLSIHTLFEADFTCAAVLISFGAVLGKLSGFQLLIMATIEVIVFKCNEIVGVYYIKASDLGGSMFVHVFGAYFGLAVALIMSRQEQRDCSAQGSSYRSDMFSMIGTIFLWLYWPSFNSALASDEEKVRAVLNTYLSLAACCVTTFAMSSLLDKRGKVSMEHIQNATLAGGVAVGTCCNMMIHPGCSLAIGTAAGFLSVVGFNYISNFLDSKLYIHDTCGVNNLHGMPGLMAGICGAIAAYFASDESYGSVDRVFEDFSSGSNQALRQGGALLLTFVVSIVGGLLTGAVIRCLPTSLLQRSQLYNDSDFWNEVEFDESENESIDLKAGISNV